MATFQKVTELRLASRDWDAATLSRCQFWIDELGPLELSAITEDQVDAAMANLARRGKLRPVRNGDPVPTGEPLAPSTINRFISEAQGIVKYARRNRIVPRTFVSPFDGLEKEDERPDPQRYLRPEQVEKILTAARVFDTRWGKLEALITVAYHTGLRIGNLQALRWSEVDLDKRTLTVFQTKNGHPHVAGLSPQAVSALARLPRSEPLVFCGRHGRPYHFRRLWNKCCASVGLAGKNFHQLRHGCGHRLATAGVNHSAVMHHLGHRTLTASVRYMHANVEDKLRVVDRVFGGES